MKCLNKLFQKIIIILFIVSFLFTICSGCSNHSYDVRKPLHIPSTSNLPIVRPSSLSNENVVIPYDAYLFDDESFDFETGLLINETSNSVVTAINPHKRMYPASMTKILTAIVVMDAIEIGQISLHDTVVIQKPIQFEDPDALTLGLKPGDFITVNELMHGLLISSYNDCAVALARYVSGSVNEFNKRMNNKAKELGATNSNFINPHGMHNNIHYTTPYDLYLVFKEFLKNEELVEIDSKIDYILKFYRDDEKIEIPLTPTNGFLSNSFEVPNEFEITGWKTGTTDKAGRCIILQLINKNTKEKYICLVANAKDYESLYENVLKMINQIN